MHEKQCEELECASSQISSNCERFTVLLGFFVANKLSPVFVSVVANFDAKGLNIALIEVLFFNQMDA